MMTQQRCAICDCDRDGNVWPESAEFLCDAHWTLAGIRDFVRRGALSDWEPLPTGKHPVPVCHDGMQTSGMVALCRQRRRASREDGGVYHETQLMTELAVLLARLGVQFDTTGRDSFGDEKRRAA